MFIVGTDVYLFSKMSGNSKLFKIGNLNVRSLVAHFPYVRDVLIDNDFDIFCVTETWLGADMPNSLYSIKNYKMLRKDRPDRAGGVAVYLRGEYVSNVYNLINTDVGPMEYLLICIKTKKCHILVAVVYRPPRTSLTESIAQFHTVQSEVTLIFDHVVVTGDVNVNMLNLGNPLSDCFNSYNLIEVINEPTRVTQTTATLLDPMLVSDSTQVTSHGVINTDIISDHSLVYCHLKLAVGSIQRMYTFRCFKHFNEDVFYTDMLNINWNSIYQIQDFDNKIAFLTQNLVDVFNVHAPVRTVRLSRPPAPWLTDALKLILKQRNIAFNKFERNKTANNWNNYKEIRNFALAVRREKAAYLKYVPNQDTITIWKRLRAAGVIAGSRPELPAELQDPDRINDNFLSIFAQNGADRGLTGFFESNRHSLAAFDFALPTQADVKKCLGELGSNAAGIDDMSLFMVRVSIPVLLDHFTHIINVCLEAGYFPAAWRTAVIFPLPKGSSPSGVTDLRPVSLLPVLSKLLEKVVYRQLLSFVNSVGLLPATQSGFHPGFRAASALINLNDLIFTAMDRKLSTTLILLDYSKAFDCVDHNLMCAKLKYFGLSDRALSFFKSYLFDRWQVVRTQAGTSALGAVTSGVPQGSILGPLLFLLYTFDMNKVTKYSQIQSYADDTQVLYSFDPKYYNDVEAEINTDLSSICLYSERHGLRLNANKTKVLLFTSTPHSEFLKDYIKLEMEGQRLVY